MKFFRLVVPILAGAAMAVGTVTAFAHSQAAPANPPALNATETNLLPSSFAEDIHADPSGKLWITEIATDTVRQLDPATRAYTLYTGLAGGPRDAQLGPDGKLWWLEGEPQAVARMDLSSRIVTTWPVTTSFAVALAFDTSNRVWFVDGILSGVYRFDPNGSQFCDYALPGTGGGPFIAQHNGALWLSDIVSHTLGRITPTAGLNAAYTDWPLSFGGGSPLPFGVTFAPNGDVWWADRGLSKIGRLEPAANRMRLFGPPQLYAPEQVAYQGGKVWFTDPYTDGLGFVDPALASGLGPYVAAPATMTLTPDCSSVGSGFTYMAGISTGVSSFSALVFTTTVGAEGTYYQAPAGGEPFGLAAAGFEVWTTDIGRDKLIRIDNAQRVYLPTIRR